MRQPLLPPFTYGVKTTLKARARQACLRQVGRFLVRACLILLIGWLAMCRRLTALLYLYLLMLASPAVILPQQLPDANQGPVQIIDNRLEKLTLLNLGETYHALPRNIAGAHARSKLTLKVGIRFRNISSNHVIDLDVTCFRIVGQLVFPEPLVGPFDVPDEFPSPAENHLELCFPDLKPHKVVRLMPGKSYEIKTRLTFDVIEDGPAEPPQSLNPGVYFLKVRMAVSQRWDVEKLKGPGLPVVWSGDLRGSESMRFVVRSSRGRRTRNLT